MDITNKSRTTRRRICREASRPRRRLPPTSATTSSAPLLPATITTATTATATMHTRPTRKHTRCPLLPICSTNRSRTRSTSLPTNNRPSPRPPCGLPRSLATAWPPDRSARPPLRHITSTSCTTTIIRASRRRACPRGRAGATRARPRGTTRWEETRPRPRRGTTAVIVPAATREGPRSSRTVVRRRGRGARPLPSAVARGEEGGRSFR